MSFAAWYADDDDNFGPLKNMRARPVWNVSKANRSLGEEWESMEPECTEISHILAKGGARLEAGFKYEFIIRVNPCARVKDVDVTGPVFDVVGRKRLMSMQTFVVSEHRSYCTFTRQFTDEIVVVTDIIKHDSSNVSVRPVFDFTVNTGDCDILTLAERIQFMEKDFEICCPTGDVIPIHALVLRANSVYFDTVLRHAQEGDAMKSPVNGNSVSVDDEFSPDIWELAVEYMYSQEIRTFRIDAVQELIALGDKYLVKELPISASRRIIEFLRDREFERAKTYVMSLLTMSTFYMANSTDSRFHIEMQCIITECQRLIDHNPFLWKQKAFVKAWYEFLQFREKVLPPELIDSIFDDPKFENKGKRKWGKD